MFESNVFQKAILIALNKREERGGGHMYEGTVSDGTKARRRAADKRAKAARKIHRRSR
jgi:hypothetical protein